MKKTLFVLGLLAAARLAYAGLVTHTDYTSGATITATLQNTNENAIINEINGNLDSTNIRTNGIVTANITDGSVTTSKLANNAVTLSKFDTAGTTTQILIGGGVGSSPVWTYAAHLLQNPITATSTSGTSQAGSGFSDTNLSAQITVSTGTSGIIVDVDEDVSIVTPGGSTNVCSLKILRNGTSIYSSPVLYQSGTTPSLVGAHAHISVYDVHNSTTNAVLTYKVQIGSNGTPASCNANNNPSGNTTTAVISLYEMGRY